MSPHPIDQKIANTRINDVQLSTLITLIAKEHGIEYVASPSDWSQVAHDENIPSIARPNTLETNHHNLMNFEAAISDSNSELSGFMLYEAQNILCDAGLPYSDLESPIVIGDNGLEVNNHSPISLAIFLLSLDRTFEQLSNQMTPEFYQNQAISTAWFARSINTLKGQPLFSLSNNFSMSME